MPVILRTASLEDARRILIKNLSEIENQEAIISSGRKSYTVAKLIEEIRAGTDFGNDFLKSWVDAQHHVEKLREEHSRVEKLINERAKRMKRHNRIFAWVAVGIILSALALRFIFTPPNGIALPVG